MFSEMIIRTILAKRVQIMFLSKIIIASFTRGWMTTKVDKIFKKNENFIKILFFSLIFQPYFLALFFSLIF